ncbi:LysE family translocator [Salinisphaera sp. RV14]|uniref:LysE family translocator n=1 Tax=Salinisphaera sp. RV14 TaxID=3454140 RepID=UPI003F8401FD
MTLLSWSLAVAAFAFIVTFTPGPNNLMLAASAANFGMRRTTPHIWGVALGFPAMLLIIAFGLSFIVQISVVNYGLRVLGIVYILYLAYRIATIKYVRGTATARPLTFLNAAAFQWVNPKAWTQAAGSISAYLTVKDAAAIQTLLIAAIFVPIGIASSYTWAVFGEQIARLLNTEVRFRCFNFCMALVLVLAVVPVMIRE